MLELPPGWSELKDPRTRRKYWRHEDGRSTFVHPATEAQAADSKTGGNPQLGAVERVVSLNESP